MTSALASCRGVGLLGLLPILMVCQMVYSAELPPGDAPDGDIPIVMRVEQDWECVLNEPGSNVDAPQFHSLISPFPELDSFYLQVCWNYREQHVFTPGGMQLQGWQGEFSAGKKNYREDKLSTTAETITWTQSLKTNGSVLTLGIDRASSATWGTFGGSDTTLSGNVGVPNLNGYCTSTSVNNSWVSYGANRVDLLRIKEVRCYDADGNLVSRDTTSRVVYQLDQ